MALVARSDQILRSPDSSIDSEFPAGDKPPATEALAWDIQNRLENAGINAMETGTPFTHDVRQYLSGSEALTAIISFVLVSGDDPIGSGWSIEGDGTGDSITYDGASEGSGSFRLRATGNQGSADSSTKVWSCQDEVDQTAADFIIPAGTAEITFNGNNEGVLGGHIVEFAAGTHGVRKLVNVRGVSAQRVTIRGPLTGLATLRRNNPGGNGFVLQMTDCRHFNLTGEATDQAASVYDGKARSLKIMYATNATAGNKDGFTGLIKFASNHPSTYQATRDCSISFVEFDGGWDVVSANSLASSGIAIQTNTGTDQALYAADDPWQENIDIDDCLIRNMKGEGMYVGENPYHWIRTGLEPSVRNRRIRIRRNMVINVGGDAINAKSWMDDGDFNEITDNVVIRGGQLGSAANGANGISANSVKAKIARNWIEDAGECGIFWFVSDGTAEADPGGVYEANIYSNVVLRNGLINPRPGISIRSHNIITGAQRANAKVFSNSVVDGGDIGIQFGSNIHPECHAQNNIAVGNAAGQISAGAGSQSGNHTTGTAAAIFVNPDGAYLDGDADLSLITATGFAAAAGSTVGVDLGSEDFFSVTRTSAVGAEKGAVETV